MLRYFAADCIDWAEVVEEMAQSLDLVVEVEVGKTVEEAVNSGSQNV